MSFALRVAPSSTAPAQARHALADWLGDQAQTKAGQDALLVVNELVTNGVVHDGGDDIVLLAHHGDGWIHIEVVTAPRAPGAPVFERPNVEPDEVGRGMAIVSAVCDDVVVHNDDSGRRVVACAVRVD